MENLNDKLDALQEYIDLKIYWEGSWPLMSFSQYWSYRKEDSEAKRWLMVLNLQSKPIPTQPRREKITRDYDGMFALANVPNERRNAQLASLLGHEGARLYEINKRIQVANQNNRALLGNIISPFAAMGSVFNSTLGF